MNLKQAQLTLKKYYPNESISSYQLLMLHRQFHKKGKMPKFCREIKQAIKVINANQKKLLKKDTMKPKTITKNPLPPGLVHAGKFGGKILARRAGAAGLSFGAGPVAGAATTAAGVILTGRDLYKYYKLLRKTKKVKKTKTKRKTVKKNPVKKIIRVKVKRKIGYRIADIGKGGKEYNVKTSRHWKKRK